MKLIDRRECRDLLAVDVSPVNFHVALTNNPISSGFSVERLLSLVGSLRVYYDAQVGESGGFNLPFRL